MKGLRATTAVTVVAWMCGALFALWVSYSARMTALMLVAVEERSWTGFLVGVPWILTWFAIAAVLALLGWGASVVARRVPWLAYAYAVLVVALSAALYWATVVLPASTVLANSL